jgi:hypothetical protein
MRGVVAGATPAQRVERARERLRDLPPEAIDHPISAVAVELGPVRAVVFTQKRELMRRLWARLRGAALGLFVAPRRV